MPDVYLRAGAMVVLSAEDLSLMDDGTWRPWQVEGRWLVVQDVTAGGRRYRRHLHREVAFRMLPHLIEQAGRMSVTAINGDYLDVRRENLEILVKARSRRGPPRRPGGYVAKPGKKSGVACGRCPEWSRAGVRKRRIENARRDGPGGAVHDHNSG